MANPSLLPETRDRLTPTTSRRPTPAQVRDAYVRAQLHYHATVRMSAEAREQIRILTNITTAGREAYEELY